MACENHSSESSEREKKFLKQRSKQFGEYVPLASKSSKAGPQLLAPPLATVLPLCSQRCSEQARQSDLAQGNHHWLSLISNAVTSLEVSHVD